MNDSLVFFFLVVGKIFYSLEFMQNRIRRVSIASAEQHLLHWKGIDEKMWFSFVWRNSFGL